MRSFSLPDLRRLATASLALLLACVLPTHGAEPPSPASTPAARRAIGDAGNALLQGDALRAMRALSAVPAAQFRGGDASRRACIIERFQRPSPPELSAPVHDAFTREVIQAYRAHWWQVLRAPAEREVLEARLLDRLRDLLGADGASAQDFDALAAPLGSRLKAAGYHVQAGRTPPLQDLLLWRRQTSRDEQVRLPEGIQRTRLELLDDFVVRGWSHYANCGHGGAGGWATDEALFAVREAYGDLDGEEFQVSLLGHEAQHFADYTRFPGLPSWELEYRAKLAELSLADATREHLLDKFSAAQGDDVSAPHPHANRRVLQALRERLPGASDLRRVPRAALRAAARAALLEDSARRAATGARGMPPP